MRTLLPSTISIVTALSRTRSVRSTDVVPLRAIAPSDGSSTSLLVTLRRQRRPVREVCAVTSKLSDREVVNPTGQLWLTFTALTSMHSPVTRAVGFTMVRLQFPAAVAGALQLTGVGVGLGTGVGVGDGEGDGDGDGDGLGDGEALGLGLGDGLGDGEVVGLGLGLGDAPGTTLT